VGIDTRPIWDKVWDKERQTPAPLPGTEAHASDR